MNDHDDKNDATPDSDRDRRDWIEALLRTTGRRPAVPADRARRVELAVRDHWRAEVRARKRTRTVWFVASAAAAAAAVTAIVVGLGVWRGRATPTPQPTAALVEMVVAPAWSRPASGTTASPSAIRTGDRIVIGTELWTDGSGRLAVRMATGHSVRLDVATEMRVISEGTVALVRGGVYVDSHGGPRGLPLPFEIQTPAGSIRDVGTQFEARLSDEGLLRVRVREGSVSLHRPQLQLSVRAGEQLELSADGTNARLPVSAFGSEWAWVGEVTPMIELEGTTLADFLTWAAREHGLRLDYATPPVAAAAQSTTLHGSSRGMTLDEAIESVLTTSRMRHRIAGKLLHVDFLDGNDDADESNSPPADDARR